MNNAVVLAAVAACLNMMNDLIYRKSAMGNEIMKVYFFYFCSALSSAVFALLLGYMEKGSYAMEMVDVFYGVILGILSFGAYILFLFSFDGSNTTVSVTIFRLNLIPSIALAAIFLNEVLTVRRGVGILLCIASMLLFAGNILKGSLQKRYLLLSLAACLVGGVLNMMNKVAVINGAEPLQLLFWRFLTVGLISGVVLLPKKHAAFALKDIKYPMISGLLLMLAVFSILTALKTGEVSIVIPITQMSFVLVAIITWIVLKESMHLAKIGGILCAVIAVILIR